MRTLRKITMMIVLVSMLLMLLLTLACSESPSERDTQTSPPEGAVEIRPLNYRVRGGEDGWNFGFLRIYAINTSESSVPSFDLVLEGGEVETAEGKTYPVHLFAFYRADKEQYVSDPFGNEGGVQEKEWPEQVEVGDIFPLVPGFPVLPTAVRDRLNYVFVFRFARAATPETMKLETSMGSLSFDLSDVEPELPAPNAEAGSLADLAALVNRDNESVRFMLEDECTYDKNHKYSIVYTLTNKDKFDELDFLISGGYAVYYDDGSARNWWRRSMVDETVGPDQTIEGTFDFSQFAKRDPTYLVYYQNDRIPRVYKLSCSRQ